MTGLDRTEQIHFVTGRLAEHALRAMVEPLAAEAGFGYSIEVLPITVAALMSPAWIAKRIQVPPSATRVLIPGYCDGELEPLAAATGLPIDVGPRDLRQLAAHFSQAPQPVDYGQHDIEILAEINHCPRLSLQQICAQATQLREDGADWIDLGCEPGPAWSQVELAVRALVEEGFRVSIDSLNPDEIEPAVRAGAELVLSVNSSNCEAALDWGVEVVAIPDDPHSLAGLDSTVDRLAQAGVPLRIDPILEPIGFGLAHSLGRYLEVRRRYPDAELLMGVGNLTELTDVDSAGINTVLLGFCQELGIRSVLTTQVINWARSSVRECDAARQLVYHAIQHRVLPKHLDARLIMLRDASVLETPVTEIAELATVLRDNSYRIYAAEGAIHLVGRGLHLHDPDPLSLMEQLRSLEHRDALPAPLEPAHAFYLGYEMSKAQTALSLGKSYQQDEPLDWGLAARTTGRHYLKKQPHRKRPS
jgi:dihydropteroate synthase-like protein